MQLNGLAGYSTMASNTNSGANICAGCNQAIQDKYLLKALEQVWHENCLKCSCCDCRLGEVGSSLFVKANLLLCKQDYLRLFRLEGQCSACQQTIPAYELVMRAGEHFYHLECFSCKHCKLRFCVGDRFYLFGNRVVCEKHWDEEQRKSVTNETTTVSLSDHYRETTNNNQPTNYTEDIDQQRNVKQTQHSNDAI